MVTANATVRQRNVAAWMSTDLQNLFFLAVTVGHEEDHENRSLFQHGEHRDRLLHRFLFLDVHGAKRVSLSFYFMISSEVHIGLV